MRESVRTRKTYHKTLRKGFERHTPNREMKMGFLLKISNTPSASQGWRIHVKKQFTELSPCEGQGLFFTVSLGLDI